MSTPAERIVCLGDVMVDVVVRTGEPLADRSDTSGSIAVHAGGSAANVSAWLAEAGAPAALVARVGDDLFGRASLAALAGVDLHVQLDPDRPTGTCLVLVDGTGERTMVPDAGANAALAPAALPAGRHLHVSAYTLLRPSTRQVALTALTDARAAGWTVSVDAASAAPLRAGGAITEHLAGGLLFANEDEARVLAGDPDADLIAVARWLGAWSGGAVVKCGPAGALWSDGARVVAHPAAATGVRDTTGAGDAFAAGFLSAWLAAPDPERALASGCALAARAIGQVGARPGGARLR